MGRRHRYYDPRKFPDTKYNKCLDCGEMIPNRGMGGHKGKQPCQARAKANELEAQGLRVLRPFSYTFEEAGVARTERTDYVGEVTNPWIREEHWAPLWAYKLAEILVETGTSHIVDVDDWKLDPVRDIILHLKGMDEDQRDTLLAELSLLDEKSRERVLKEEITKYRGVAQPG